MKISFKVPGQPAGKGRPRFTGAGKTYTPKSTLAYEEHVKWCFKTSCHDREPLKGGARISVEARYKIPKSWPKWKKQAAADGKLLPMVKPDLDNVAKIILDALNGIAFEDDKNVTSLRIEKRYSNVPGVTVTIETEDNNGT